MGEVTFHEYAELYLTRQLLLPIKIKAGIMMMKDENGQTMIWYNKFTHNNSKTNKIIIIHDNH